LGSRWGSARYKNAEDILRDADIAMFQAKSQGRARHVTFLPGMHDVVRSTLRLETDMRRAVDRGEFRLLYQPQVDVDRQCISGFEALIRWDHPELGLVPPARFIPLAEKTGLITEIGYWSLEQACLLLRKWQTKQGENAPRMAVNLSPRQFNQSDLLERINTTIRETRVDPTGLTLEITEGAVMEFPERGAQLIDDLRSKGVHVCIDDFGMGYSSLSQLSRLAIDGLKIDRSFVSRINESTKTSEIVRSLIGLAASLDLSVTAEGVETEAQLKTIRHQGCYRIQGYLFSKAVSAERADKLLKAFPEDWRLASADSAARG